MKILSFQNQKNTLKTINQIVKDKHCVFNKSLTKIELLSYQQLREIDKTNILNSNTIAITSQNAANWLVANLNHWSGTIYTNSPKSEQILMNMPHVKIVVSKQAYAKHLGQLIQESNITTYSHLTGNLGLDDLKTMAKAHQIDYNRIEVYSTQLTPCKLNLHSIDVCVFTSPSQVESFFEVNTWKKSIFALCIGKTTAHCLKCYGVEPQNIYYPQKANLLTMLELLPEIEKKIEQQKTK